MSWLAAKLGLIRSLLMYYAIPGRQRQMRQLYGRFIQPGDLCFDIGAHVGNRLRVWSSLGAHTIAVEPQPQMLRVLAQLYGRSPHVTLVDQAIGAAPGEATLYISSRFPTVTTLSDEWITAVQHDESFAQVNWDQTHTVPVITLDQLIDRYGLPTFCKIDIEGYELAALQGLTHPLPALSFEYIPVAIENAVACVARLAELGPYRFNYTVGEHHQFQLAKWVSATEITAVLGNIEPSLGSGDVYAALTPPDFE